MTKSKKERDFMRFREEYEIGDWQSVNESNTRIERKREREF